MKSTGTAAADINGNSRVSVAPSKARNRAEFIGAVPDAVFLIVSVGVMSSSPTWWTAFAICLFAVRLGNRWSRISDGKIDLAILQSRLDVATRLEGGSPTTPPYFERLVTLNVENLAAYYTLVVRQTNRSFTTALYASVLGVALVVAGLGIGLWKGSQSAFVAYISTASGVITEAIAALLFYLYNKAVIQMKDYHQSLVEVQNVLLALKVANDIEDVAAKNKMMETVLSQLFNQRAGKRAGPEPIDVQRDA